MASSTLVTITYRVADAKRFELEGILRPLVEKINAVQQSVRFSVYQEEDDASMFVEVYECDSTDDYDALEDDLDEETREQIRRIATDYAQTRQSVMTLRKME
jgi:quinol monooxygenase YgiN